MSDYPQNRLDALAQALQGEFENPKPESATAEKDFVGGYNCRPIFFDDRVLWVSEECLTDEDDGADTVTNAALALKELDLKHHIETALVRQLLVTHREDSTPGPPAKVVGRWGSWRLVEPNPSVRISSG